MAELQEIVQKLNDVEIREFVDYIPVDRLSIFETALVKRKAETRSELFNVGDEVFLLKGNKPYIYCGSVNVRNKDGIMGEEAFLQEKEPSGKKGTMKTITRTFDRIRTKDEVEK